MSTSTTPESDPPADTSTAPESDPPSDISPCTGDDWCETDVRSANPTASNVDQTNYEYTVKEYLEWALKDADAAWTDWFLAVGLEEPTVGYRIIDEDSGPFVSRCNIVVDHDHPNAYYCPQDSVPAADGSVYDGVIILPETTFYKMWLGDIFGKDSGVMGDFAAGGIVGHEFGHHVQDELMQQAGISSPPVGKNKELIADCFSGNWMSSLYERNNLDEDDLTEIVSALSQMGDSSMEANDHGTSSERIDALLTGAEYDPGVCIATYWPEALSS